MLIIGYEKGKISSKGLEMREKMYQDPTRPHWVRTILTQRLRQIRLKLLLVRTINYGSVVTVACEGYTR